MNKVRASESTFSNIALVIPALDPDSALLSLVNHLSCHGYAEIIVVNDGSTFPASEAIFAHLSSQQQIKVLHHESNQGKGAALKTAFRYLCEESKHSLSYLITIDADGQHGHEDILHLSRYCQNKSDELILGVRSFGNEVPSRSRFGNLLTRKVLSTVAKIDIQDTQTGLRCLPINFAQQCLAIDANRYEFELESLLLAKQKSISIIQQPIETIYIDDNASSHFKPITDSIRIYSVFLRFISVSLLSFLLDIGLFTLFYHSSSHILGSTYLARLFSGIFNFYLNKNKVFSRPGKDELLKQLGGYIFIAIVIATCSGILLSKLVELTNWQASIAKILVDSVLFLVSYNIQRFILFNAKTKTR